jgi:uncharacterized repeat protein (TIGR03806 family)
MLLNFPSFTILVTGLAVLLGLTTRSCGQGGLDTPVAVGAGFNGIFPLATPGGVGSWQVVESFPNLRFIDPVKMVPEPRSNRLHVLGKDGFMWSFVDARTTNTKTTVLDIRTRVQSTDNAGLVGLAFHPDFNLAGSANAGYFYVTYYYSPAPRWLPALDTNGNGALEGDDTLRHTCFRLSRFTIPPGSTVADPASERVLIQQFDRQAWHNGGSIFFGNDRFLYISLGDEGLDSDYYRSMMRFTERLWGGVFRIDVDQDPTRSHPIRRQPIFVPDAYGAPDPVLGANHTYSQHYYIPNDNPWLYPDGSQLEEYFAIGVRSPHTMTYDAMTDGIWLGDVGQATWEEVNLIQRGRDYQWPYREGPDPFFDTDWGRGWIAKAHARSAAPEQAPRWSYTHNSAGGTSVIGGYVYRGREHATALRGKYLFSDHGNPTISHIWALAPGAATPEFLCDMPPGGFHWNIAAFGEDHEEEVHMIALGRTVGASADNAFVPPLNQLGQWVTKVENGKIFKLARSGVNVPEPPALLSQTGAFTNLANLTAASSFIPYRPHAPFWSDGAEKSRWVAIPNDGTHNAAAEQVGYATAQPWTFPVGTVFMKHFELPLVEGSATAARTRLETRFFVKGTNGDWNGFTYRWRADGTEADLLFAADSRVIPITTTSGAVRNQTWSFPSRSDCITCHSPNAGSVLGFNTHQLNSTLAYLATGRTANQIKTFASLGILNPAPSDADIAAAPQACDPFDLAQPLERRARSYLDTNCAACHRPGGANANWDGRFSTPLAATTLIHGALKKTYSVVGEAAVRPHDPARSIVYTRTNALGANAMPPLSKNEIDTRGVELLRAWINSLDPVANSAAGLVTEWFRTPTLSDLALTRIDQGPLDYGWAAAPDPLVPANGISARWTTRVIPPATGAWTFYLAADDAGRVRVNGATVIDSWATPSTTFADLASAPISLTANAPVDVVVEFYDNANFAGARLSWAGPGFSKAVIPSASFRLPLPGNGSPTTYLDLGFVARGSSVFLPLTGNDVDFENDLNPLSIAIVQPVSNGSLAVQSGGVLWTVPPTAPLGSDRFTYTVADATGARSNEALVSLTIRTHAEQWLAQSNLTAAVWAADSDGDGFANLLEYAVGSDPNALTSKPNLNVAPQAAGPEISIARTGGDDAILAVESSADLQAWQAAGSEVVILEATATRLAFRLLPQANHPRRYVRLKATLR